MATGTVTGDFFRDAFSSMHNILIIPMDIMFQSFDASTLDSKTGVALFLTQALVGNAAISAVQAVGHVGPVPIEAAASELLFTAGKFWYYKFLINPKSAKFTDQKLQSSSETSDLTIINTYRDQPTTLTINGNMGCTIPREFMKALPDGTVNALPTETIASYPKLSAAYLKLRQLEKFYHEINGDILVMYDMDLYIGKFTSFGYSQDADNPWVMNYDMNFKFYPKLQLHTLSMYDYAPFFDELVNRYGRSFAKDYEGKSLTETF